MARRRRSIFPRISLSTIRRRTGFISHNERKYLPQHLSEIAPQFIATLPAVVDIGGGAKLAIAESDLDDYPGLWLRGTGGNGLAATFPQYPLQLVQTSDRDYKPVQTADYIAHDRGETHFSLESVLASLITMESC